MKKLLVINACVQREVSRTNRLYHTWLKKKNPNMYQVQEIILEQENICPLNTQLLQQRNNLMEQGNLNHPMFRYAHALQQADEVAIIAPYWDLSFPAMLKSWIEAVCIVGLTFHYLPDGTPEGLCRANKLTYITTAGGFIGENLFAYGYIKAIANMFGIAETEQICAEGLDIIGADVEAILQRTEQNI